MERALNPLIAAMTRDKRRRLTRRQRRARRRRSIVGGILRICSADKRFCTKLSGDGRLIICCNSQTMLSLHGFHANFRGGFWNLHSQRPHFVFRTFLIGSPGRLDAVTLAARFIQLLKNEAQLIIELLLQFLGENVGMRTASCPPLGPKRDGGDKTVRRRCFLMKTHLGDTDSSARL